ncbi:hypothetical protein AXX17_AT1G01760 [Arabidopsis thaliana]|uniref:Uncharacterized protein n=1 Tax=Arabidopsis thaliana TaxID=3702 RepID=A0A178W9P5_ARATH|nr:hypothetical protein AXX17_AT1G01760 [Arabidopsis thaliana]
MGQWLRIRLREVHQAPFLILQISPGHKHPLSRPEHQPVKTTQQESIPFSFERRRVKRKETKRKKKTCVDILSKY